MKSSIEKSLQVKIWPSDKPLFKYLKKEYAAKLFDYGELRIGTLYDFRNCEAYGDSRGDKDEGKKAIYESVGDIIIKDHEHNPLSPFIKQYISIKEGAKNTRLVNGNFTQRYDCEDCYIYCMSEKHNKALYDVFEADTCVRIKSPYKFMRALYLVLKEKTHLSGWYCLSPCVYCSRMQYYGEHNAYYPAIIKPKSNNYKIQKEVRAIWLSDTGLAQLTPCNVYLDKKLVTRYCEIFSVKNK